VASLLGRTDDGSPPGFWRTVADELFKNMFDLHDCIDTYISLRAEHEGFSALLVCLGETP
jgi:hypothetical protein